MKRSNILRALLRTVQFVKKVKLKFTRLAIEWNIDMLLNDDQFFSNTFNIKKNRTVKIGLKVFSFFFSLNSSTSRATNHICTRSVTILPAAQQLTSAPPLSIFNSPIILLSRKWCSRSRLPKLRPGPVAAYFLLMVPSHAHHGALAGALPIVFFLFL